MKYRPMAFLKTDGGALRIIGIELLGHGPEFSELEEAERPILEEKLREAFSNSCGGDDPSFYFWARASKEFYDAYSVADDGCYSYLCGARQDDPKSGFFIHEGVVYLSDESEALAARIAADEQRELTALIGEAGVKSKGGRL